MSEDLGALPWSELIAMRQNPKNSSMAEQLRLAPAEHRAYAREHVLDSPVLGTVGMLAAIPGYSLAKALRLLPKDKLMTPASIEEMAEGYRGLQEGLTAALRGSTLEDLYKRAPDGPAK